MVIVATIDSIQGREAEYVIVDLIMGDRTRFFFRREQPVIVGITRGTSDDEIHRRDDEVHHSDDEAQDGDDEARRTIVKHTAVWDRMYTTSSLLHSYHFELLVACRYTYTPQQVSRIREVGCRRE